MIVGNDEKLVSNSYDKERIRYIHINFKTSSKLWISIEKVHGFIKFNPKAWLNWCIDMNTELYENAKNWLWKSFLKLMNHVVFVKTVENVKKNWDIKLLITEETNN